MVIRTEFCAEVLLKAQVGNLQFLLLTEISGFFCTELKKQLWKSCDLTMVTCIIDQYHLFQQLAWCTEENSGQGP
jgi:hypothetical protein